MSTLGFGILTLLARDSLTGYEISRLMQVPVGYMWTASHSQIYGELATLDRDRLVRHQIVAGPGPRDTKRYTLTARGRRALINWIDSPLAAQPARSELMLRVRGFWLLSPQRCREFIESVRLDHEQRLAVYRAEDQAFTDEALGVSDPAQWAFGSYATLQAGLRTQQAMIDWCTWLLAQLDGQRSPAHTRSLR